MSSEDWIKGVRDAGRQLEQRESERLDAVPEVWLRLAQGELSAEERQDLEKKRADDPELDAFFRTFEPLTASFKEELVEKLAPRRRPSLGTWLRRWWWSPVLAGVATAALLLIVSGPQPATLPPYSLEAHGGDSALRSNDAAPAQSVRASLGSRIELRLIPDEPIEGALEFTVRLRGPDGEWIDWAPATSLKPGGALQVSDRVGDGLPAKPGTYRAYVAIGSPGADEETLDLALRADKPAPSDWQLHSTVITVTDAP